MGISNKMNHVYVGGDAIVSVWDINQSAIVTELDVWNDERGEKERGGEIFAQCMKLLSDGQTMVTGGETSFKSTTIWDLTGPNIRKKGVLASPMIVHACYDLVVSPDNKLCFTSSKGGDVAVWDLHNHAFIRKFHGGMFGGNKMDISADGTKLWAAGTAYQKPDYTTREYVNCWDIRQGKKVSRHDFNSEVCSVAVSSKGDWLAAGLENSRVEFLDVNNLDRHHVNLHEGYVNSLKFANSGKWFVSTSQSREVVVASVRGSSSIFKSQETSVVKCCDVSKYDKFIVTAGGEKNVVNIYEVIY